MTKRLLVLLLALLLGVTGCGSGASDRSDFVTRSGATLQLDGQPFRFVGFSLYDAAASDIYSCQPDTRLDDAALAEAMTFIREEAGATVLRFWAYQTYTAGGTDWSGVDRVIAAAKKAGLRVMPVLEDGPGNCSTGQRGSSLADADARQWYAGGYRKPYGNATLSYRDYAAVVARHYRDEPAIVAWTLVNEAETWERTDGESDLVGFARDMAAVVHRADPHHLVTLGSQSNGAPGASGPDFTAVYGLDGLDLTEVHDWRRNGAEGGSMPGGGADGALPSADADECRRTDALLACSFAGAQSLGKPIVVGEMGLEARDQESRVRRAEVARGKMTAAFDEGASGYLVWQLNTANTDGFGVLVGTPDPLFAVLKAQARSLR